MTADVWATDDIPADLPQMVEFKTRADAVIKERYGVTVEHVCAMDGDKKRTYQDVFYRRRKSSKNGNTLHKMYGWPYQKGSWCNDRLKVGALSKINRWGGVVYLGIAADEPERFKVLSDTKKSPLVAAGWTEADARRWCEENDLLSPIYTTAARGGCWFCHNQGVDQLRLLRRNYPEYWQIMLRWDEDSPVTFKADGHTIHDFDRRFEMEDKGLVPFDKPFRWKMVADRGVNDHKTEGRRNTTS